MPKSAFLWLVFVPGLFGADSAQEIIAKNCLGCHGAAKAGGLDLRSRDTAMKGGARGASVVPGHADQSRLIAAVKRTGDVAMPPGKKGLAPEDVATLEKWVNDGFEWASKIEAGEPSWWSFRKVRRPAVPAGNATNAIDSFINAKLAEKHLTAAAKADKRTLIRRATFDLHGLPPKPEDVDAFLKDKSPDAWEKLLDKLLASPRYGERWGRHWLDVVRYADTGGFETDIYFPNAWRYRDYVIQAFNKDKPFDTFVKEQIAGDEIWPDNLDLNGGFKVPEEKQKHLDARIATGLYTIGPVYHEAALFGGQQRYEWLTDVVDTTGEAFLGLTMGCSRCHDHKFDPITRRDYHGLMAIFAAYDERDIPVVPKFNIYGFKSGYPRYLKVEEIKSAIGRIDKAARERAEAIVRRRFSKEALEAFDAEKDSRTPEQVKLAMQVELALTEAGLRENAEGKEPDISYTAEETRERDRLIVELGQASLKANPVMPTATVLGKADKVEDVFLTSRGDWRSKGDKVDPALPAVLNIKSTAVDNDQRRRTLAEWLTSPDHPLTARVMVNRVWHWHFGRGIVATPGDFGRQGEEPINQPLLDWLSAEFMESGWSMKRLHKLIMTSDAYTRSSEGDAKNAAIDANNLYLWRMNRRRVEAEALRDMVLAASGDLNLKMGGRPVIPKLSKEEYSVMWAREQWPEAMDPAEHDRRSVYLYVKRSFPMPMMTAFDSPDSSVSCSRRDTTTVAPQALTMMNGEFMMSKAANMAKRIAESETDPAKRIQQAFRLTVARDPSPAEMAKAREQGSDLARLCLVLLNTNEFVYID